MLGIVDSARLDRVARRSAEQVAECPSRGFDLGGDVRGSPVAGSLSSPTGYSLATWVAADGQGALIEQWLKAKDTVPFFGVWEQPNNPEFNSLEFEGIRNEAGRNNATSVRRKSTASRFPATADQAGPDAARRLIVLRDRRMGRPGRKAPRHSADPPV